MAKNKYKVEISYLKFTFDDRMTALDFAETAFNSAEENRSVEIKLVKEEEDDDE